MSEESLALRHSIQLEKLQRRITKLEEIVALNGKFQAVLDIMLSEHKKRIDNIVIQNGLIDSLHSKEKGEQ